MYGIDVPRAVVNAARDNLHAHIAELIQMMSAAKSEEMDELCERLGRADAIHVFLTDLSIRVSHL